MNFARTFALVMLSCSVLTGCDAIRSALGKPTSEDIAALRLQREQMKRTADSLAAALGGTPDSLEAKGGVPDSLAADADSLRVAAETGTAEGAAGEKAVGDPGTGTGAASETASKPADATASSPGSGSPESEGATAAADTLQSGYYVVLGSFKNEDNARYLFNSLSASGCDVHLVKMKNGFTAVMICRGDTYEDSYGKMLEFYGEKTHPDDIWIYNTNKHLHIQQP